MTARRYDSRVHKPVKTLVEDITFDSGFEANVYRHIRMLYPKEYITCHEPILLLPESAHFPALSWRCDFKLSLPWKRHPFYIEAKGVNDRSFKLTLQILSFTAPEIIENLLVVHPDIGIKIGRTVETINIHILYQLLQRFRSN